MAVVYPNVISSEVHWQKPGHICDRVFLLHLARSSNGSGYHTFDVMIRVRLPYGLHSSLDLTGGVTVSTTGFEPVGLGSNPGLLAGSNHVWFVGVMANISDCRSVATSSILVRTAVLTGSVTGNAPGWSSQFESGSVSNMVAVA